MESLRQLLSGEPVAVLSDESDVVSRELGATSCAVLYRSLIIDAAVGLKEPKVAPAEPLAVVRLSAAFDRA
jgi:hypothetical protein